MNELEQRDRHRGLPGPLAGLHRRPPGHPGRRPVAIAAGTAGGDRRAGTGPPWLKRVLSGVCQFIRNTPLLVQVLLCGPRRAVINPGVERLRRRFGGRWASTTPPTPPSLPGRDRGDPGRAVGGRHRPEPAAHRAGARSCCRRRCGARPRRWQLDHRHVQRVADPVRHQRARDDQPRPRNTKDSTTRYRRGLTIAGLLFLAAVPCPPSRRGDWRTDLHKSENVTCRRRAHHPLRPGQQALRRSDGARPVELRRRRRRAGDAHRAVRFGQDHDPAAAHDPGAGHRRGRRSGSRASPCPTWRRGASWSRRTNATSGRCARRSAWSSSSSTCSRT